MLVRSRPESCRLQPRRIERVPKRKPFRPWNRFELKPIRLWNRFQGGKHFALESVSKRKPFRLWNRFQSENHFDFGIGHKPKTISTLEAVSKRKAFRLRNRFQNENMPSPSARTRRFAADGKLGVHAARHTLMELHGTREDFRPFRPSTRRARGLQARRK
jgi:hypothetical protein